MKISLTYAGSTSVMVCSVINLLASPSDNNITAVKQLFYVTGGTRRWSSRLAYFVKQLYQLLPHRQQADHQWRAGQDRFMQPGTDGCHRGDDEHAILQVHIPD